MCVSVRVWGDGCNNMKRHTLLFAHILSDTCTVFRSAHTHTHTLSSPLSIYPCVCVCVCVCVRNGLWPPTRRNIPKGFHTLYDDA